MWQMPAIPSPYVFGPLVGTYGGAYTMSWLTASFSAVLRKVCQHLPSQLRGQQRVRPTSNTSIPNAPPEGLIRKMDEWPPQLRNRFSSGWRMDF
jgi:hypothetical protein